MSRTTKSTQAFRRTLLYVIIHMIFCIFAIYLSYKCNGNSFHFLPTVASLFVPYLYVLYELIFNFQCMKGVFTGSVIKV